MAKNVINIRFKKGIAGNAPEVHTGRNFKTTDKGIVRSAPASAAFAVVFFQNIPNKNMANTPGDTNPTYS